MSLSPAPLSLLIKAAPILTEDMYGDIQPAAWELLLSTDEHMAAAAGESAHACIIKGLNEHRSDIGYGQLTFYSYTCIYV